MNNFRSCLFGLREKTLLTIQSLFVYGDERYFLTVLLQKVTLNASHNNPAQFSINDHLWSAPQYIAMNVMKSLLIFQF